MNSPVVQQAQALSLVAALQTLSASAQAGSATDVGAVGTGSATISGLGQLFGNLHDLRAANPAQFKQVASQVAGALQSAAQQQTGEAGQVLTDLSNYFQQASSTGNLPQAHHHHRTHGYTSNGQPVTSTTGADSSSSTAVNIQQLFVTLAQQVGASTSA